MKGNRKQGREAEQADERETVRDPADGETSSLTEAEEAELALLEGSWSGRLERFTAPEPAREDTARLIARVRERLREETAASAEPASAAPPPETIAALRSDRRSAASGRPGASERATEADPFAAPRVTPGRRWARLLRSQWHGYGTRSWLLTGLALLAAGAAAYGSGAPPERQWTIWLYGITMLVIAVIGYAFRPRDEGTELLEQLGQYSVLEQTLARLAIVTGFQLAVALPVSAFVYRGESGLSVTAFTIGWTAPMLFLAVLGFVLIQWAGIRLAFTGILALWAFTLAAGERLAWMRWFLLADEPGFVTGRLWLLGAAAVLLALYAGTAGRREPV
ncbi:hypothetical protein J31TS4_17680 [Paenibacillus sp. J31TS4]|uniref:hypothetical protein n=1 Tax=Paenibacillus sp. J31TS4 TaxID=2807195 RepID=UPI001B27D93C|nr:hypothetical protein [Paenibacillus sp. J31TS4]GIP38488.1 hypothetical protein J31TS4_17680 [Paenibacillus sp. J31TS4]